MLSLLPIWTITSACFLWSLDTGFAWVTPEYPNTFLLCHYQNDHIIFFFVIILFSICFCLNSLFCICCLLHFILLSQAFSALKASSCVLFSLSNPFTVQLPSDGPAGQQSGPSRVAAVGPYIQSSTMPRGPVRHDLLVKPAYPDGTATLPAHDPQNKASTGEQPEMIYCLQPLIS